MTNTLRRNLWRWGACLAIGASASCEASKSSNPLSPAVAGPIPGVSITAPKNVSPDSGVKIAVDKQPIRLVVENAATSGPRPLTYLFEIAVDLDFANKVFTREGIVPGDGRTSLQLPDALATGRTYYWRARAQDGANTGPYSAPISFTVFTPVVIGPPNPIAPVGNVVAESMRPRFTFDNSPRSGPAGGLAYSIQIADSDSFAMIVADWRVAEQPNQTSLDAPVDLPANKTLFWHVRGNDPTTTGPWSATQVFRTPSIAAPTPPGGGPYGPSLNDAIDLRQAVVYNSPADVASWPATAKITTLTMQSPGGLSFEFTTQQTWPDYRPPGWSGGLQYTVWAVVKINGQWHTSGFVQMWRGRPSTGAPILSDFARNWAYDARWGPMAGYQPQVGELMGFFLTAGDARGQGGVTSVRERSNVVVVPLPAGDNGVFVF